jgi:hypothetical protein
MSLGHSAGGVAATGLDVMRLAEAVATDLSLLVRQLPRHIGTSEQLAYQFFSRFGNLSSVHLLGETPSEEWAFPGSNLPQYCAVVRYASANNALAAKAILDQARYAAIPGDNQTLVVLSVAWVTDDAADDMIERCTQNRGRRRRQPAPPTEVSADTTVAAAAAEEERRMVWCLLSNLFDPVEEAASNGPQWASSMRDEVLGEIDDLAPIDAIVDDWTRAGRVAVRFASESSASQCCARLGGRTFGPRVVHAAPISTHQVNVIKQGRSKAMAASTAGEVFVPSR